MIVNKRYTCPVYKKVLNRLYSLTSENGEIKVSPISGDLNNEALPYQLKAMGIQASGIIVINCKTKRDIEDFDNS